MRIHINTGDGFPDAKTLTLDDGSALKNVSAVDIKIRPMEPIIAILQFLLPGADLNVEATVTEEHLRELADAHGFDLVKKPGAI